MSAQSIDRRILIVGVPRSGTTLLQSLLAAHSEITSFTESHFFARHFTFLPGFVEPVLTRNPTPRIREFLIENDEPPPDAALWFLGNSGWPLRLKPLLPLQTRSVAHRLLGVLDELAIGRGVATWVEKTPRHLRYIPFLEKLASGEADTRFIHVVRQGMEVVASLYAASQNWERPYDLDTCIERWNRDVAFSLGRTQEPRDHFVRYEELTTRTEATVRRLLAELSLPWEKQILEQYGQAAARVVANGETWKADVSRSIRPAATSDRVLTADQRARVDRSLRHDLYQELLSRVTP